jgi:hypothetical protein
MLYRRRYFLVGFVFGCSTALFLFISLQTLHIFTNCRIIFERPARSTTDLVRKNNTSFNSAFNSSRSSENIASPFLSRLQQEAKKNRTQSAPQFLNVSSPALANTSFSEEVTINDVVIVVITGYHRKQQILMALKSWIRHVPKDTVFIYSDTQCWDIPNCKPVGGAKERAYSKQKVIAAFDDVYNRYPQKKWYMKVDDDTFVVIHHLLKFLRHHNSSEPHYIGRRFFNQGEWYCEGGAGYLFSRALLDKMMPNKMYHFCMSSCRFPFEDVCTGVCMQELYNLKCERHDGGFHQEVSRDAVEYAVDDFYGNAITFHHTKCAETATVLDFIYYPQDWHNRSKHQQP